MATGVSLELLVQALRAELLQSVNPMHGASVLPAHRQVLQRTQRHLHLDFDWPHLRVDRDIVLAAGQRYYDLPADMDLTRVESASVKYGSTYQPVARGIGPQQMNSNDSDAGARIDPDLRWAPYGASQIEVWPVPLHDAYSTLRLRGIRKLNPLVSDSDTCDLDEDLIVTTAAAELLSDSKSPRAQAMAERAASIYAKLKQRSDTGNADTYSLGTNSLESLLAGIRAELLEPANPSDSPNHKPARIRLLQRTQRTLWMDFAWPHMRIDRDIPLLDGVRYYSFPTDLSVDRIESVAVRWGNIWLPVVRGIGVSEYNAFNSDAGIKSTPVQRWKPTPDGQIEVWPMPAGRLMTLRLRGIRNLLPLAEDSDVCDLNPDLLVLTCAAELLSTDKNSQLRANAVANAAKELYAKLKHRTEDNDSGVINLGEARRKPYGLGRRPPLVAVDRGSGTQLL